ncbi:PAS domain-containing protein [Methanoregula sp.]|uniref:PAS domain-containing protein n=1 Tax=Methanoregula sp. TaxID=2052170 RepID=UPI002374EC58|nr:PAS domain-containing protein [Methanoregula sp.]MDD1687262.1 PAS domain-containing protein [Methanoregula sp.]
MTTHPLSDRNETLLHVILIGAAYTGAIVTTIFSLTHGIIEVFPLLYILPIILGVYFFPERAMLISLGVGLTYIGLVFLYGLSNSNLLVLATAWFAIFITIGVVFSSYANKLLNERSRIRSILDNSQDGIFCFDRSTGKILEMNAKCIHWLRCERADLIGKELATFWTDAAEREQFLAVVKAGSEGLESPAVFRAKDGTMLQFMVSSVLVTHDRVLCSAIDVTGSKIIDEEIRKTLEDLEGQVKARTAHLEKINAELQAEILERRRFEISLLSAEDPAQDEREKTK